MNHWILQENFQEESFNLLRHYLHKWSISNSTHKFVPFDKRLEPDYCVTYIERDSTGQPKIVVMGSYSLVNWAKEKGYWNTAFDLGNNQFFRQYANWGDAMFNHEHYETSVKKILERPDSLSHYWRTSERFYNDWFLKPENDDKAFDAGIFSWPEFKHLADRREAQGMPIDPNTQVIMAIPKPVAAEYRLWVVDKKVVAWSQYKRNGRLYVNGHVDEYIRNYGEAQANFWSPCRAYVMDIFQHDKLYIGECNTLNASGLYKSDIQNIIKAIEEMK